MIITMKPRIVAVACWLLTLFAPALAMAADDIDARIDCYARPVVLDVGGAALTWFVFIVLSLIMLGVLFKNANRSHLD